MKSAFLLLAMLPTLAMASSVFVPTKQHCQALYQDVIMLMSYVAPCDKDVVNPTIIQEYSHAKAVMDERLGMCHKEFSSSEQDAMMDELVKKMEPTLTSWQNQIANNQPAFCQAQKKNIAQRLSSPWYR